MKRLLSLILISLLLAAGCSNGDKSRESEIEKQKAMEQIAELSRQSERLNALLNTQTETVKKLEERLARLESTVSNGSRSNSEETDIGDDHVTSQPLEPKIVAYSADSELKMDGLTISSPSGNMLSDSEQEIIGGDLRVATDKGTFDLERAIIESHEGKVKVSAKSLRLPTPAELNNEKQNNSLESNSDKSFPD